MKRRTKVTLGVIGVAAEVEISVKSQISGVVKRRFADVGDYVQAGAPLLEIKPNPTPLDCATNEPNPRPSPKVSTWKTF